MKYIFLLLLFSFPAWAQQDSTVASSSFSLKKWEELRVGIDLKPIAQRFVSKGFSGFAAYAEASFDNKLFLSAQWGFASNERSLSTQPGYFYSSKGQFLQLQIARNVLYGSFAEDAFSFGFAYGVARFGHSVKMDINSVPWGDTSLEASQKGMLAHWVEGTCTLGVKPAKRICLQACFRIRVLLSGGWSEDMKVAEIPGFGYHKSRGGAGMAYRVLYVFGK